MMDCTVDPASLSSYFNDLQQEKGKLENKLEAIKVRRKDLESKLDLILSKYQHLQSKHENMERVVNVAKIKVQESQSQVNKLQNLNDDLDKKVQSVKLLLSDEQTKQEQMMIGFQSRIDELASFFRKAAKYYTRESLAEDEVKWRNESSSKKDKVFSEKAAVDEITSKLNEIRMQSEIAPDEKPATSAWQNFLEQEDLIKSMFVQERLKAEECLKKLGDDTEALRVRLEMLDVELASQRERLETQTV